MSEIFKATVILTAKEYATLKQEAALLGPGTVSAAIRKRLGWHLTPPGHHPGHHPRTGVGVLNDHT